MARIKEHKFKLNNEEYHLTWIDKPRITKKGIEQKILPVLREYIITENLAIQLVNNNGNEEVPYTLARKVLGYFSNENKAIDKKEVDLTSHKITSKSFALVNKKSTMDINISVDQKIEELLKKLDWNKIQDKNKKKLLIIGCSHSKNGDGQVNVEQNYFAQQNELIDNRNMRFDQYSGLLLNNHNYFQGKVDYYSNLFHNHLYLPAINRYSGRFYSEPLKQLYLEKNENANLHILIISGLYGVIEFKDSIIDYHLEISRKPFWTRHNNITINEAVTSYIDEHQIENEMVFYSLSQGGNYSYVQALKPLNDWNNIWIIHDQGDTSVRFLRDHFLPEM
ncbi:MAG: Peroxide stress protein YaaA [Bacteroidota bacterium]|jgi:hypothetical protein